MARGTSLETTSGERASSCVGSVTTWFFWSCGGILELRRGIQDASSVGPSKSNLPFELRRRAGHCSPVTAGQIDLILACVQKVMFLSRGDRDLGVVLERRPVWGFPRGTTGSSGSLSCGAREVRSPMRVARGSASLLSSHGRGIWPQDALKKDSRGLSRVAAGNPGFPRLVPVTSGSFSGCL